MGSPLLAVPSKYHSLGKGILLTLTTVAEIPFRSKVTEQEEKLPFAVAVMSNPGKSSTPSMKLFQTYMNFRYRSSTHGHNACDVRKSWLTNYFEDWKGNVRLADMALH